MITLETRQEEREDAEHALSGEGAVLHAHYYDAALHRAITETGPVDGRGTLERAAASAAYRAIAETATLGDPASRLRTLFATTGLGALKDEEISAAGGAFSLSPSSYATARLEMFGKAPAPACDVTRGIVSGALGALFGKAFSVREVECVAMGDRRCRFEVTRLATGGLEPIPALRWPTPCPVPERDSAFPSADVLAPVRSAAGSPVGSTYGSLWAELYARAAHDFEQEVPKIMGPKFANLPSVVLTEAAHLGTFYSVGSLIRSSEWQNWLVPRLPSREDWVHAVVALLDSFGWGSWRVKLLAPEQRFTVHVHDGYEARSHLALAGPSTAPRCYFARGVVAAIMNVLYAGDSIGPAALNQSVYNSLFRSPLSFRAMETRCQAMGHPYCEFVANPLSPGLRRG